jgi:hypothetical protein
MPVSLELWRWRSSANLTSMELLTPVEARHHCKLLIWQKPKTYETCGGQNLAELLRALDALSFGSERPARIRR